MYEHREYNHSRLL